MRRRVAKSSEIAWSADNSLAEVKLPNSIRHHAGG